MSARALALILLFRGRLSDILKHVTVVNKVIFKTARISEFLVAKCF